MMFIYTSSLPPLSPLIWSDLTLYLRRLASCLCPSVKQLTRRNSHHGLYWYLMSKHNFIELFMLMNWTTCKFTLIVSWYFSMLWFLFFPLLYFAVFFHSFALFAIHNRNCLPVSLLWLFQVSTDDNSFVKLRQWIWCTQAVGRWEKAQSLDKQGCSAVSHWVECWLEPCAWMQHVHWLSLDAWVLLHGCMFVYSRTYFFRGALVVRVLAVWVSLSYYGEH